MWRELVVVGKPVLSQLQKVRRTLVANQLLSRGIMDVLSLSWVRLTRTIART